MGMRATPSQSAKASVHFGSGYRVYFQQRANSIIVLLCGGEKGTQAKDIKTAKRLAKDWSE